MFPPPAPSAFVHDAIFIYNSPIPDVIASIRLVALIPARHIGLRVLYFGAGMDASEYLAPCFFLGDPDTPPIGPPSKLPGTSCSPLRC